MNKKLQKEIKKIAKQFKTNIQFTKKGELYKKSFEEFKNNVYWYYISTYQNLSEDFIREFEDSVDWNYISRYQNLSEDFIREFKDKVYWYGISAYQNLSSKFRKEFKIEVPKTNWLYKPVNFKLKYIKENTDYEVIDDKYIIAYKSIRNNNYSIYNFQYKYEIGEEYKSHCDCNIDNENSFGLSAWTKKGALDYYNKGKLIKVKIAIKDIGAIVHNNNKIRCFKFKVLEEIK